MGSTITSVLLAAMCLVAGGAYLLQAEFNQGKIAFCRQLQIIKAKQATYPPLPLWNMPSGTFHSISRHNYKFTQV